MELSKGRLENYQKNLQCIHEVTGELVSCMKGHHYSFLQEITDEKGNFSQEKLCHLVKELLTLWTAKIQDGADRDPATGERVTEPYLKARRELYGLYLYLTMRCSLHEGAYASVCSRAQKQKEQTDFAFLLKQAEQLSRDWCVTKAPDGSRKNELIDGFDHYFGFHLYHIFENLSRGVYSDDFALSPDWRSVYNRLDQLTDEGNMKRILLRHPGPCSLRQTKETEEAEADGHREDGIDTPAGDGSSGKAEEDACDNDLYEEDDDYDAYDYDDYDPLYDQDDLFDLYGLSDDPEYQMARMEAETERAEKESFLTGVYYHFIHQEEYLSACRRFTELFEQAGPDVLRDFRKELEEIVDLYLAERKIAPLTDTDQTLDVYSRIYDGALRQAKRYERSL